VRAVVRWFAWFRRAELLRACCANLPDIRLTSALGQDPGEQRRTQWVISDYRQRMYRDPERDRWRTSAVVIVVLSCALVTVVVLWTTGRQLWGGPFDPSSVGSLGEWASGVGTVLAVYLAIGSSPRSRRPRATPNIEPKRSG
jgi:hypothetical protein